MSSKSFREALCIFILHLHIILMSSPLLSISFNPYQLSKLQVSKPISHQTHHKFKKTCSHIRPTCSHIRPLLLVISQSENILFIIILYSNMFRPSQILTQIRRYAYPLSHCLYYSYLLLGICTVCTVKSHYYQCPTIVFILFVGITKIELNAKVPMTLFTCIDSREYLLLFFK